MIIEIGNFLISEKLFEQYFCCDLASCKGRCCVEGDAGAPITENEALKFEEEYHNYKHLLTEEHNKVLECNGFKDFDGEELVTPLVKNRNCVYSYYDGDICKCAVEAAFIEEKSKFRKPVSCYMYPIRTSKLKNGMIALNYSYWDICRDAIPCGQKLQLPVFRFLKSPIIDTFGADLYLKMEEYFENQQLVR